MAVALGLVSVIVSAVDCPGSTVDGTNAFVTVGGGRRPTLRLAEAALPVFGPALLVVTAPAGITFVKLETVFEDTDTVTVQLPKAGMVPPENVSEPPPAVARTDPPA